METVSTTDDCVYIRQLFFIIKCWKSVFFQIWSILLYFDLFGYSICLLWVEGFFLFMMSECVYKSGELSESDTRVDVYIVYLYTGRC